MGKNRSSWRYWAGVALPLVRRIFSEIVAKDFVSVQPMNLPSGLVFYLDFKYGTAQPGFATGAGKDSQNDSVFGVTETTADPSGGLYGAGRFGYSINDVSTVDQTLAASAAADKFVTGSLSSDASIYDYDSAFGADLTGKFSVAVPTASMAGFDEKGIRGFRVVATGITDQYPQFTKLVGGDVVFVVKGAVAAANKLQAKYHAQPSDISRGDFEDKGSDLDIPELNVEMKSLPIVAKTRKLKAQWTPEFAQDLNAYHSIDAEAELTSMLSEYISQEIDFEILDMLMQDATGAVYAPYIPLIMTPLVYDPKNFTPRKGVMTRYAKKMLRGEFYGKVYVDSLNRIQ